MPARPVSDNHHQPMTEQNTSYDAWMTNWLEEQQGLWQAWLGPTGDGEQPAAAAVDGFSAWLGGGDPLAGEIGERLVGQGRQFLQLAEALGTALTEQLEAGADAPDWQRIFTATVEQVRTMLDASDDGQVPGGALVGLLDEWRKIAARYELPSGDGAAASGAVPSQLGDYLAALHGYSTELIEVQRDALDRLQRELDQQFSAGGSITSLRELYNLWVDASEAAYAEHAVTERFVTRQSELAYAEHAVTERFVTRQSELAHALCRLHAAGHEMTGGAVEAADSAAAALRRELERLRDDLTAGPADDG